MISRTPIVRVLLVYCISEVYRIIILYSLSSVLPLSKKEGEKERRKRADKKNGMKESYE